MATNHSTLRTTLAGLELCSPVMLAAGTSGVLDEIGDVIDLSRIGAVVTKSITRQPREGNSPWRLIELPGGMLNAIGLANPGLDAFVEHVGPRVGGVETTVVASVAGFSVEDYVTTAAGLAAIEGVAGIELNVSCPNVHGGVEFGSDAKLLGEVTREVVGVIEGKPLLVKLSPLAPDRIVGVAGAAVEAGASALTLCNTVPGMAIDVDTRRPKLANVCGGLSGPGTHAAVVRLVHEVYQRVAREAGVPIIGVGGVMGWRDAAEFILAGATCVQVGTALFVDPKLALAVTRGLAAWVDAQGAHRVSELVGEVRLPG